MAFLLMLLFALFLALFGLFVAAACFGLLNSIWFLGALFCTAFLPFSACASRPFPHFFMCFCVSNVCLFTSILVLPVFISTSVWLSVSTSTPRPILTLAQIPVVLSVTVSG